MYRGIGVGLDHLTGNYCQNIRTKIKEMNLLKMQQILTKILLIPHGKPVLTVMTISMLKYILERRREWGWGWKENGISE